MIARLCGLGAALALAGAALADTATYTASVPFTDTNWSRTLTVPKFDPSLGRLDSVEIAFGGNVQSTIQIENVDPFLNDYTASASYGLVLNGASGTLLNIKPTIPQQTGRLEKADGVVDYRGPSGVTISNLAASASGNVTLTEANDLVAYIGTDNASFPVSAKASGTVDTTANSANLILTQASANVTVTYNYTPIVLGSLGDRVWFDANANGKQDDGEKGVANVTVKLLDAYGKVLKTDVTDENGDYLFTELGAGDYRVQFDKPAGYAYAFTKKDAGSDDEIDSDVDAGGLTELVHLDAGQDRLDVDAGLVGTLCLGDRVWKDLDRDGLQDSCEPGVPNVPIRLLDADGNVVAETKTDSCGLYKFCNLAAGSYTVEFDAPEGYGFTKQFANSYYKQYDSNADADTGLATVNLTSNDMTIDAGLVGALKIGDTVWLDCDGDGKYEPETGEKGIPNVYVTLYGDTNNDGRVDVVAYTKTDAKGQYLFSSLTPGLYQVSLSNLPSGLTQTYDLDGLTSKNSAIGRLSNGADRLDFDFGYKKSVKCGGVSHCWWKFNTKCWPSSSIWVGGKCHTKSTICSWMKYGDCADKSINLYQRLCAAKLNVGSGCDSGTVYSCGRTVCSVKEAIKRADAWLAKYPVGCNVRVGSAAWNSICDVYSILDKYCGK